MKPDLVNCHVDTTYTDFLFSQIEEMSRNQECNPFRAFLCEAIRSHVSSQCQKYPQRPEIKKIEELVMLWLANPDHTSCQSLASKLKVTFFHHKESKNDCLANQLGLLASLAGFGALDLKLSSPFDSAAAGKGKGCTQLIQVVERSKKYLKSKENFCKFAVYGIGTLSAELDGGHYGGHCFTLVQYPTIKNDKVKIRYRCFQSYLNEYSLRDQIQSEKERHQPDGSFSHKYCTGMLNSLKDLNQSKVWSSETDTLHKELFSVSLPDLLGKIICEQIGVNYYYKTTSNDDFLKNFRNLTIISQQINSFAHLILLPNDEFIKKLKVINSESCPLIIEADVIETRFCTLF